MFDICVGFVLWLNPKRRVFIHSMSVAFLAQALTFIRGIRLVGSHGGIAVHAQVQGVQVPHHC